MSTETPSPKGFDVESLGNSLTLASTILIGLFFLLLGIADLMYANKMSMKFYYYGRGIGVLLFGLAVMLYPFKNAPAMRLGGVALTVIAAYFVTMTTLYHMFQMGAYSIDYALFLFVIRLYIPLLMSIEDEYIRTIIDVIFGGVLLLFLIGTLVFPLVINVVGTANALTIGGLVTTFFIFNSYGVNLTFLLLPGDILTIILRLRFLGGFFGLILSVRNKEFSIARIKSLKKLVSYLFMMVLFIIITLAAYELKMNFRNASRAKVAFISYVLYDLGFFIRITYALAKGLYKRCE